MDTAETAVDAQELSFQYDQRLALDKLNLSIPSRQIFALLGPNGSGKTTLFRILSTLETFTQGRVSIFGYDLATQQAVIRRLLGVVFQSASIDRKLTVLENIRCQAALYGLRGKSLQTRIDEVALQLNLRDRLGELAETLSGGLKRRVELAKGILHRPRLLLLDEPSTGLDPAARLDLWQALQQLKQVDQVSIVLTTHLLEEADKADCIAIMDHGTVVAYGPPDILRTELGSQVLSIRATDHAAIVAWLAEQRLSATDHQQQVQVSGENVAALVAPLTQHFGSQIKSLTLSQPSLEDVFIARTGHQFRNESADKEPIA